MFASRDLALEIGFSLRISPGTTPCNSDSYASVRALVSPRSRLYYFVAYDRFRYPEARRGVPTYRSLGRYGTEVLGSADRNLAAEAGGRANEKFKLNLVVYISSSIFNYAHCS